MGFIENRVSSVNRQLEVSRGDVGSSVVEQINPLHGATDF